MKIINGVHDLVIVFIPLPVHPDLLELVPGKERQDGVLAAVEHDESAALFFHYSHPVRPIVGADETGVPVSQIRHELSPGSVGIVLAHHE